MARAVGVERGERRAKIEEEHSEVVPGGVRLAEGMGVQLDAAGSRS